ncbi:MAG: chitobiase/beta-hexosaminidase C-terminal domain-containing protein [Rhodospirillales bacterium]
MRATPAARLYDQPQTVALDSSSADDAIYYTLDGSIPTTASTRYTGPLTIAVTTTISAIGVNSAGETGQVRTFAYTIDPDADLQRPEVTASLRNGTYETRSA